MPVIVEIEGKILGFYFAENPFHGAVEADKNTVFIAYGYRRVYKTCFWLGEFISPEIAKNAIVTYFS